MGAMTFPMTVLLVVAVILWVASAVPFGAQGAEADLEGVWMINEDLSDDPRATAPRDRPEN